MEDLAVPRLFLLPVTASSRKAGSLGDGATPAYNEAEKAPSAY